MIVGSARRRRTMAATGLAGTGLLGVSLSREPGSAQFYGFSLAAAGAWTLGGWAAAGPPGTPRAAARGGEPRRTAVPVLIGIGAFGAFYGCALVARQVPLLDRAIVDVLRYDHHGASSWVLFTTLANGVAEEIFFRGALYDALPPRQAVLGSTLAYALVTTVTRNPALVLASTVMGTLFGLQRRAGGGVRAPAITHLTWSTLMLRYLPPLFRPSLRDQLLKDA